MKHFSISDIESLTGIKAHTIRIWEQRYDLFRPKRTDTNIRYYDDNDLCLFLNIATLNQNGYKISKISKMSTDEIIDTVKNLQGDVQNASSQSQALCNAMIKMDEREFEYVLDGCINKLGLEDAMTEILFPFLCKVGEMWQVGTINPAHEHFATHKIVQKIIEATYAIKISPKPDAKKFVLFLPPLEQHELGLLFAQFLVRKYGHHCLYLGQNLPFETLAQVISYYEPDFAFTVLTTALSNANIENTLENLKKATPNVKLIVTGNLITEINYPNTDLLLLIKSITCFTMFLSSNL